TSRWRFFMAGGRCESRPTDASEADISKRWTSDSRSVPRVLRAPGTRVLAGILSGFEPAHGRVRLAVRESRCPKALVRGGDRQSRRCQRWSLRADPGVAVVARLRRALSPAPRQHAGTESGGGRGWVGR